MFRRVGMTRMTDRLHGCCGPSPQRPPVPMPATSSLFTKVFTGSGSRLRVEVRLTRSGLFIRRQQENGSQSPAAEIIKGWTHEKNDVWKVSIPNSFFGKFNPYSDLIRGDWFQPKGRQHHTGAVYLNGEWLVEAAKLDDVPDWKRPGFALVWPGWRACYDFVGAVQRR